MITIETSDDDRVVIAIASGRISADDYESTLIPAVEAASAEDKARLLYILGDDFDGYDAEAALDDLKLGLHHWTDFDRIGLVTEHESWRVAVRAFGFLMPGEVQVFDTADEADARAWIAAD